MHLRCVGTVITRSRFSCDGDGIAWGAKICFRTRGYTTTAKCSTNFRRDVAHWSPDAQKSLEHHHANLTLILNFCLSAIINYSHNTKWR